MSDGRWILGLALAVGIATPAAAQEQLVISTWGFNGDLLQEHLYKPFEAKHGVEIVLETGNNAERLTKIKVRGGSQVDIVYLADAFSQEGINEGLFAAFDRTKVPNIDKLYPIAQAPHGKDYGPAYTIGRFGIIYDTAKLASPISSWKDLWRAELEGRASMPNITTTAGPLMVLVAADRAGVSAFDDTDAAFASLAELKPNLLKTYGRSSELANMFAQGEVIAAAAQDFVFSRIKEAVPTAAWADLAEGPYANVNTINITKGSAKQDLAYAFIDWALSAEVQKALAVAKVDAPANMDVKLTAEEAAPWTYGGEMIYALKIPDWAAILEARDGWTERYNEMFAE